MSQSFDVAQELLPGLRAARQAISRGGLVVLPTDTVYGIAADAFVPAAVQALVAAKGRTLASPPPVLIPGPAQLEALAAAVPDEVRRLTDALWPGPFTVILPANPALDWDLGDTRGTVALRVPADPVALELLADTGPLACSSANRTGQPPAITAAEAAEQLGDAVEVYLEGGPRSQIASTIVDATEPGRLRIIREGAVVRARLVEILGDDLADRLVA